MCPSVFQQRDTFIIFICTLQFPAFLKAKRLLHYRGIDYWPKQVIWLNPRYGRDLYLIPRDSGPDYCDYKHLLSWNFSHVQKGSHLTSHETLRRRCLEYVIMFSLIEQAMSKAEFKIVSSSEICQLTGGRNRSQGYGLIVVYSHLANITHIWVYSYSWKNLSSFFFLARYLSLEEKRCTVHLWNISNLKA